MGYSFVQSSNQNNGTSPITTTFSATPTQGNLILVSVMTSTGTISVQDGNSNVFTQLATVANSGRTLYLYGYIAGASQSTNVVVTRGTSTTYVNIYECTGNPSSLTGIVDISASTTDATTVTTTNGNQPSITTTNANDMVFSQVAVGGVLVAPSMTGGTLLQSNTTGAEADGYQAETSTGTYSPYFSWTTPHSFAQLTVALLPATIVPLGGARQPNGINPGAGPTNFNTFTPDIRSSSGTTGSTSFPSVAQGNLSTAIFPGFSPSLQAFTEDDRSTQGIGTQSFPSIAQGIVPTNIFPGISPSTSKFSPDSRSTQTTPSTFVFIQDVQTATGSGNSLTINVAAVGLGHLVIVNAKFTALVTNVTVTDNASIPNTYALAIGPIQNGSMNISQYYGVAITGGATQITISWTTTTSARITVDEFSGNATSNAQVFDTAGSNTGSGTSASVSLAPSNYRELIAVAFVSGGGITQLTPSSGYVFSNNAIAAATSYRLASSLSETPAFSWTSSVAWAEVAGAYKMPSTIVPFVVVPQGTMPTATFPGTGPGIERFIADARSTQGLGAVSISTPAQGMVPTSEFPGITPSGFTFTPNPYSSQNTGITIPPAIPAGVIPTALIPGFSPSALAFSQDIRSSQSTVIIPQSPIQYIQQICNTFYTGANSTTLSVSINNLPSIGNALIGVIKKSGGAVILTSIADPRGNTWNIDNSAIIGGLGAGIYNVSCYIQNAYQAGDSLTLTFSGAVNDTGMICAEFSGLGVPRKDVALSQTPSGTRLGDIAVLPQYTANPFELVVVGIATGLGVNQTFIAPGTPWVQLLSAGGVAAQQMNMAYQLATSTGVFSNSWSWPVTASDAIGMQTYFPAGGAATQGSVPTDVFPGFSPDNNAFIPDIRSTLTSAHPIIVVIYPVGMSPTAMFPGRSPGNLKFIPDRRSTSNSINKIIVVSVPQGKYPTDRFPGFWPHIKKFVPDIRSTTNNIILPPKSVFTHLTIIVGTSSTIDDVNSSTTNDIISGQNVDEVIADNIQNTNIEGQT